MTAPKKSWSTVVATTMINAETEDFVRDTEVQVKLITKPSREYIYELLTKTRFPLSKIEAIVERRGNTIDFTCTDRTSAENLQRLLNQHPNVREARLFESEFIEIKLTGVPHRLPDSKLIAFLAHRNGEVLSIKRLKDRKGYYDGRRIYKMRTADLQTRPISQFIRVCDCNIKVDYHGQPVRCFLCKQYGHMRNDCPEAVKTPPMIFTDEKTVEQMEISAQQDPDACSSSTPVQRTIAHPQAPVEKSLQDENRKDDADIDKHSKIPQNGIAQDAATTQASSANDNSVFEDSISSGDNNQDGGMPTEQKQQPTEGVAHAPERPTHGETDASDSELDHYSDELELRILASTPTRRDNTTKPGIGPKRALSSNSSDELKTHKKREVNDALENICFCGETLLQPKKVGVRLKCRCERYHVRCICNKVFVTKENGAAHCFACTRVLPSADQTF